MHYAARNGHTAVVELLLQRGANSEAVDWVRTCRVDGRGVGEEVMGRQEEVAMPSTLRRLWKMPSPLPPKIRRRRRRR